MDAVLLMKGEEIGLKKMDEELPDKSQRLKQQCRCPRAGNEQN